MNLPESLFLLDGWCSPEKSKRLYDIVKETGSLLTVESGVFGGRSLIPFALSHKDMNKGRIICMDPWAKSASTESYDKTDKNYQWWDNIDHDIIFSKFINALFTYNISDIVKIYRKTSRECIDIFTDESIDIFHQDANHTESVSSEEVEMYHIKIKQNGLWIMDDTDWVTTLNAQKLILTKGFVLIEDYTTWKIYKKIIINV